METLVFLYFFFVLNFQCQGFHNIQDRLVFFVSCLIKRKSWEYWVWTAVIIDKTSRMTNMALFWRYFQCLIEQQPLTDIMNCSYLPLDVKFPYLNPLWACDVSSSSLLDLRKDMPGLIHAVITRMKVISQNAKWLVKQLISRVFTTDSATQMLMMIHDSPHTETLINIAYTDIFWQGQKRVKPSPYQHWRWKPKSWWWTFAHSRINYP